ncbi:MAG TPA: glycoside hydrolase family 88 protein [Opitutaceae bacterium]|nr:glycoside hydrolase family 88 protein [Opitutaceae bacterium]
MPHAHAPRLALLVLAATLACPAFAAGPYVNQDDAAGRTDPMAGSYPVPYHKPTAAEITAQLVRVRTFLETAMPARIIDRKTRQPITDLAHPVASAATDNGEADAFKPLAYEVGVLHSGMLAAAAATGDKGFSDFTARQLQFIADAAPYFRAQAAEFGLPGNSFRGLIKPEALDDCGAMTAALIQARLAGVGPDLRPVIDHWADYIAHGQFRLPDGTLARHRPQAVSVWGDDMYMGVPALAEMGKLTGERSWYDDAAKNTLQISKLLFRPSTGLFTHGWNQANPDAPAFYWGRANGWAMLTMCDLLDVLPADHPDRAAVLRYLRAQVKAVAGLQSGRGLWHQMLDRNDSYLETSASAIFTYCIAHAVDQGWISPVTYGNIALAGWIGVSTQINAKGQVENTCVGTTFAGDMIYYYNRPVSVDAVHGYGPVLLAGAEIIRLLHNDAFRAELNNHTYRFVPKGSGI